MSLLDKLTRQAFDTARTALPKLREPQADGAVALNRFAEVETLRFASGLGVTDISPKPRATTWTQFCEGVADYAHNVIGPTEADKKANSKYVLAGEVAKAVQGVGHTVGLGSTEITSWRTDVQVCSLTVVSTVSGAIGMKQRHRGSAGVLAHVGVTQCARCSSSRARHRGDAATGASQSRMSMLGSMPVVYGYKCGHAPAVGQKYETWRSAFLASSLKMPHVQELLAQLAYVGNDSPSFAATAAIEERLGADHPVARLCRRMHEANKMTYDVKQALRDLLTQTNAKHPTADTSYAKVRVCEYLVIGNFGQALPSTTMPEETSEEERQALYQGVTDAAVAQLVAMSRDELAKYLRRHMHVVGPLPESRMELLSLAMDVAR